MGQLDPAAQPLLAVQALADHTLRNNGTLAPSFTLRRRRSWALPLFFERPSWDEYLTLLTYERVLRQLIEHSSAMLVNVNVPRNPRGIRWTRQSIRQYDGESCPARIRGVVNSIGSL